tara:strand:+ start:2351 stop:2635 length:285 start_codon:yes stop_codon:yes gene_type:complete
MEEILVAQLSEYGVLGLGALALAWYIIRRDRQFVSERDGILSAHKEERAEARALQEENQEQLVIVIKESNAVQGSLTTAIAELKTIIQTRAPQN